MGMLWVLYIGRGWLAEAVEEGRRRWPVVLHQCFSYSKGRQWGTELGHVWDRSAPTFSALLYQLHHGAAPLCSSRVF
jgi:hypothetical protein